MEIITQYDFLLLPIYLLIFYLIVRKKSKKYESIGLRKTFVIAFWLRMIGAVGYALLLQYYYGYGDSFGFYRGGNVISGMIQQDITAVKYLFYPAKDVVAAAKAMGFADSIPLSMPNDSNAFIMKLSAVVSFFTFNKYMLISVCFGFFSFIGVWKLFYVFYQMNEKKQVKLIAFFVLFLPSLWFWGSGLLKEPVCLGALGIITYLFYKNFIEKNFSIRDMIVLLLMLFILTIVKNYITAILLLSFFVVFLYKVILKIRVMIFRIISVIVIFFAVIVTLLSIDITSYMKSFIDDSVTQLEHMQKSYQLADEMDDVGSKGAFSLSKFDPSIGSLISHAPAVIATCLFRPFVWESKKIIIFFASLETLVTLLMTIYILFKTRVYYFFKYIFSQPFLLFCFIFSMLFALVIGYTTFNFGTMIRYKIIFLPFYFFMLISVYGKYKSNEITKVSLST